MLSKRYKISSIIALLIGLLLLSCGGSGNLTEREKQLKISFPSREYRSFIWDKFSFINLNSENFPDSISFFLPIVEQQSIDMDNATLVEEISGWIDTLQFDYQRLGIERGTNLVIVEDVSASVGDYLRFMDNIIWGFLTMFPKAECEVSIIRFGEFAEVVMPWSLPENIVTFSPESLSYPDRGGSELFNALQLALDLTNQRKDSPCAILLFTDGDFISDQSTYGLIDRANRYKSSINVFMHGKGSKGVLSEIADKTGGIYLGQPSGGFSPEMVYSAARESYYIRYSPENKLKEGALHRICLIAPKGIKYRGEYRAPGTIPYAELDSRENERENDIVLPDLLLSTVRVPFGNPGNDELPAEAVSILDSVSNAINGDIDKGRISIKIDGYTCDLGSVSFNMLLSKRRALCVKEYLNHKIGDEVNFDVSWYGEMYPLNGNENETQRKVNRRVEITVDLIESDKL